MKNRKTRRGQIRGAYVKNQEKTECELGGGGMFQTGTGGGGGRGKGEKGEKGKFFWCWRGQMVGTGSWGKYEPSYLIYLFTSPEEEVET